MNHFAFYVNKLLALVLEQLLKLNNWVKLDKILNLLNIPKKINS